MRQLPTLPAILSPGCSSRVPNSSHSRTDGNEPTSWACCVGTHQRDLSTKPSLTTIISCLDYSADRVVNFQIVSIYPSAGCQATSLRPLFAVRVRDCNYNARKGIRCRRDSMGHVSVYRLCERERGLLCIRSGTVRVPSLRKGTRSQAVGDMRTHWCVPRFSDRR